MRILVFMFCFLCAATASAAPPTPAAYMNGPVTVNVTTATPLPIGVYSGSGVTPGFVLTANASGTPATFQAGGGGGSGTVTSITAGTGLTGGTITTSGTIALGTTAVTAGSYTNTNLTVNAQGQITAASNGSSGGSVSVTAGSSNIVINPTPGTGTFTVDTGASPTFATSVTTPLVIGGTGAASTLTLESTSGSGTTDSIIFKTGSQTTQMTVGTTQITANLPITIANAGSNAVITGSAWQGSPGSRTAFNPQSGANSNFIDIYSPSTVTPAGITIFAGIGTSGSISNYQALEFRYTGSSVYAMDSISTGTGTVFPIVVYTGLNSNQLYLSTGGGVGIGTSTIQNSSKLQINGTIETGVAGATLGSVLLAGNTSGVVSIIPQAAAGTYNFNLPITVGTSGYALLSGGGGSTAMTWSAVAKGSGGTPTCGTGCASITAGSTDLRGSMVSGSSVSAVTLNFSGTLASAPFCTISDSNTSATADIASISTSALTVNLASALTSVTIYWNCPL